MNNEISLKLGNAAMTYAYDICKREGRTGGSADFVWTSIAMGKLAELVVEECIATIPHDMDFYDRNRTIMYIRNHFGVEEQLQ